MPGLTLATMRDRIKSVIPDAAISDARINAAIQIAHEVFPMEFFVDHTDETLLLATDTYEYALPETSNVSTFVLIRQIWLESDVVGVFDSILPKNMWRATYDGVGVWQIVFSRQWSPIAGRHLRIEGQKRYTTPAADGDIVTLHNGWVLQYAIGLLHASEGGSDSSMASWHQRMAAFHMAEADKVADNMNSRARPDSVQVPGVI